MKLSCWKLRLCYGSVINNKILQTKGDPGVLVILNLIVDCLTNRRFYFIVHLPLNQIIMKSIYFFIPIAFVAFNLFDQSLGINPNLTKELTVMSKENSYNPFVVDLETWYDHPDEALSFKIDYTPIAGTTLSPYGLVCRINSQFKIGPYGGPIREIIITHDSHMQVVSDPSLIIDLRIENKWIQAHYNGKMLPLFFNRIEATVYGVWSASHPMETAPHD